MMTQQEERLHLRILAPTSVIFDGQVDSVSAENHVGSFDVLPGHTNFFTLLSGEIVQANELGRPLTFNVQRGIMKVHDNVVVVYANIGSVHEKAIA